MSLHLYNLSFKIYFFKSEIFWVNFFTDWHYNADYFLGKKLHLKKYIYWYMVYQWWLFNQRMLSKNVPFIFWKFILTFAFFFCKFRRIWTASFSLFFKFNIRFFRNILWDLHPKRILLCMSESMSQKLFLYFYYCYNQALTYL